jgi:hypothetical protein
MPSASNGQPPQSIDGFVFDFDPYALSPDQNFTVRLEASGKYKALDIQDDTLELFPGVKATITNLDTGDSLSFVASGTVRTTELEDDTLLFTLNGPNLSDGRLDKTGYHYTAGHFSFEVKDVNGNGIVDDGDIITEPLSPGNGMHEQLIDNLIS